jgi:hypothetical protein
MSDTPLFQWHCAPGADPLLRIAGSRGLRYINVAPPAPHGGWIRAVGRRGTADPGALVQIVNRRDGGHVAAYADRHGAFALRAFVAAGDELWLMPRMRPTAGDLRGRFAADAA